MKGLGESAQRGVGAGRAAGAGETGGVGEAGPVRGNRSIVSTSKGTPAARSAWVTTSAGAAGSAAGSRRMTR
jgi:hypothetical protein